MTVEIDACYHLSLRYIPLKILQNWKNIYNEYFAKDFLAAEL